MEKKKIIALIPARLDSQRFPEKVMKEIFSMPMIGHVYKRTALCKDIDKILIITPDKKIKDYAENILKATVIEENRQFTSIFDTCAAALEQYQKETNTIYDIAVIVSGDEPMVTHDMIAMAISPFYLEDDVKISNLMCPIGTKEEFNDHNEIKVVVDTYNNALYFSREPIPSHYKGIEGIPPLKVIGVTSFDAPFLLEFKDLAPGTLELIEDIATLRALEYGYKVKMIMSEIITFSVDTPEDLEKVKKLMAQDNILKRYLTEMN